MRYEFGNAPFLKQQLPTFIERADAGEAGVLDMFQLRDIARRQDAALEAELAGFFDAGFGLGNAANLAGKADFAKEDRFRVDDIVPAARGDRRDDAQIDRGLVDVDAAGHVDENILIEKLGAHFLFQHGDEQGDAVVIDANRGSSRHSQERPADERLQFD